MIRATGAATMTEEQIEPCDGVTARTDAGRLRLPHAAGKQTRDS
jgi:hypothetical protein